MGGIDRGLEKDIGEGQLRAEVEAEAALRDPDLALRVVQGSEAKRKEDTAEAKVAPDQNQERKDPEKAGLNQNPRKKTIPELKVGPSREKTVDPSPSQDRENSEV